MKTPPATPGLLRPGMVAPRYDGSGLAGVLPAVAGALGVTLPGHAEIVPSPGVPTSGEALVLPAAERVCVVLVDGLGYDNLAERAGHAPFLRSMLGEIRPVTTVFPSTTAAALGALGTGTSPGRTGMVGYTQRIAGRLANMVSWEGAPNPEHVQREPRILSVVANAGVNVTSTGPERFAGSGLTRAALAGGRYLGAQSLDARVDVAVSALRRPGLVYLYWGDVDKVGHHHGWQSWQWGDALSDLDRAFSRLARSLPVGTLVVLSADHGMVDVDPALRWDIAEISALADEVDLVGGEPRCVHLYTSAPSAVADRWRSVLGSHALVLERGEAVAAGLFGPDVADHVMTSLGDVVVAMAGRATVVDSRTQTSAAMALVGVHGSLTEQEMRIPLLTWTV